MISLGFKMSMISILELISSSFLQLKIFLSIHFAVNSPLPACMVIQRAEIRKTYPESIMQLADTVKLVLNQEDYMGF